MFKQKSKHEMIFILLSYFSCLKKKTKHTRLTKRKKLQMEQTNHSCCQPTHTLRGDCLLGSRPKAPSPRPLPLRNEGPFVRGRPTCHLPQGGARCPVNWLETSHSKPKVWAAILRNSKPGLLACSFLFWLVFLFLLTDA